MHDGTLIPPHHHHQHHHPPVCVGFLQTYLYGICILQTFIWLSGLGPRGAGAAWGSVSQMHSDGWAGVVCATLYWVSCDYPTLCFTHKHTHTAERETTGEMEEEWDEWREEKTDEAHKEEKRRGSERIRMKRILKMEE